jgi:DNA-binding MarR family transcriptional regulator
MSLDEATMDLSDVFEYGQGYVALSRVRRLSGLFILGWNERAFKVHPEVLERDSVFRQLSSQAEIAFSKLSPKELKKMHDNFVLACGGTIVKGAISKVHTPKPISGGDTLLETLALWKKGKTVSAIAKARNLKETTIFDHIEKLAESGQITKKEALRLVSKKLSSALPKIKKVFTTLDTTKLTPVYEKLGGDYSYDEIRIARLLQSLKK